jgi:hypothetical protein
LVYSGAVRAERLAAPPAAARTPHANASGAAFDPPEKIA